MQEWYPGCDDPSWKSGELVHSFTPPQVAPVFLSSFSNCIIHFLKIIVTEKLEDAERVIVRDREREKDRKTECCLLCTGSLPNDVCSRAWARMQPGAETCKSFPHGWHVPCT